MRRHTAVLVAAAFLSLAFPLPAQALPVDPEGAPDADLPDLVVVDVAWSPAAPVQGDNVTFTATVKNQGNASGGNSTLRFTLDGNTSLGDRAVGPLAPGASVNVTSDAWTAVQGNHTVRATADALGEVEESREDNNERTENLTVAAARLPDLVVQDITWTPANPVAGDNVTFTAKVKNQGNATAGNFSVEFLLDGAQLGDLKTVASLAPNATVSVTSDGWTAIQGNHSVKAVADALGEVEESREDNNERTENLTVAPLQLPDLVVQDITWSPASPVAGDNVTFTAQVKNQGAAAANASHLRFHLDSAQLGADVATPALAPGASVNLTSAAWTAIAGNHSVRAEADVLGQVNESEEANNARDETVHVAGPPLPDLVVGNLTWSPAHPVEGDAVVFTAVVRNQGDAAAANFTVLFKVDGVIAGERQVTGLGRGATANVSSDAWMAVAGTHTASALADAQGLVEESREDNNLLTAQFEVVEQALPDLVVEDIAWSPGAPTEGEPVTFTARVRNQGNASAENSTLRFTLDGAFLGDANVSALAPGASLNVSSPGWTSVEGNHTVRAEADALGKVAEEREDNNARQETFTVGPAVKPDLVVEDVRPDAQVLLPALNTTFTARVRNQGTGAAGPFHVRFMVDNASLGDVGVSGLAPGAAVNVTSPGWSATLGNHTVVALADALGEVAEVEEGNNARGESFFVPSVQLLELALAPHSLGAGDRLPPGQVARAALDAAPLLPSGAQAVAGTGLGIAALLAALYHRIHGPEALQSPTRRRLVAEVRADPGCTVGTLARRSGLSYKTVQRHVRVLRRVKVLQALPGPQERLFVAGALPPGAAELAAALRAPSARRLLARLRDGPKGPRQLARELGLAPSTVAHHAARLEAAGLVVRLPGGGLAAAGDAA